MPLNSFNRVKSGNWIHNNKKNVTINTRPNLSLTEVCLKQAEFILYDLGDPEDLT